jgi:hypothetical protein
MALRFCKNCLIIIKCGYKILCRYNNVSCSYLENHTAVKGEEEVLFPCGTTFTVLSVEKNLNYFEVVLSKGYSIYNKY